jgi:hypothetical protein
MGLLQESKLLLKTGAINCIVNNINQRLLSKKTVKGSDVYPNLTNLCFIKKSLEILICLD